MCTLHHTNLTCLSFPFFSFAFLSFLFLSFPLLSFPSLPFPFLSFAKPHIMSHTAGFDHARCNVKWTGIKFLKFASSYVCRWQCTPAAHVGRYSHETFSFPFFHVEALLSMPRPNKKYMVTEPYIQMKCDTGMQNDVIRNAT